MPGHSYYRERPSGSSRRRGEPQADSLTICLTIQVLAVLLLILAAWLLKRNNPQAYEDLYGSYHTMATAPDSFGDGFFGAFGDAWKQVEKLVYSLPFLSRPDEDISLPDPPGETSGYDYLNPPENAVLSPLLLSAALRPPITGAVTSPFAWRIHPVTRAADFHTGLDIAAEEGRAILAVLPGEVTEVGESEYYGNYIVLRHAANLETSYSHCSKVIAGEGMRVKQGERIARVGQTGTATGPHLHFSVIAEGLFTDPRWVLTIDN